MKPFSATLHVLGFQTTADGWPTVLAKAISTIFGIEEATQGSK